MFDLHTHNSSFQPDAIVNCDLDADFSLYPRFSLGIHPWKVDVDWKKNMHRLIMALSNIEIGGMIDNLAALGNAAVLDGERGDAIKYKGGASAKADIQFRHVISVGHYSLPKIQNFLSGTLTVGKLIEFGHLLYFDNEYRVQSMAKPSSFYGMRHGLDLRATNAGSLGIITSVKWGSRVNQTLSELTVNDVRNLFQDCRYDEECEDWILNENYEGKKKVEENIKALAAERGVTL